MSGPTDLDRALVALADPRRRQVIELLRRRPHRAGEIAAAVGLSPAALTRHLRILKEGGLVDDAHPDFDARVRIFSLTPEPMAALKFWLGETEQMWSEQLKSFKARVEGHP